MHCSTICSNYIYILLMYWSCFNAEQDDAYLHMRMKTCYIIVSVAYLHLWKGECTLIFISETEWLIRPSLVMESIQRDTMDLSTTDQLTKMVTWNPWNPIGPPLHPCHDVFRQWLHFPSSLEGLCCGFWFHLVSWFVCFSIVSFLSLLCYGEPFPLALSFELQKPICSCFSLLVLNVKWFGLLLWILSVGSTLPL